MKWLYKLWDKLLPPIKFKKKWFKKKELQPTDEDLDKWATEYEEKFNKQRKRKHGN